MKHKTLLLCVLLSCPAQGSEESVEVREGAWLGTLIPSPTGDQLMLEHQGQRVRIGECADEERSKAVSMDGMVASVFERNCGATVDFATHIELQRGDESASVAVFEGSVPIEVERHGPIWGRSRWQSRD